LQKSIDFTPRAPSAGPTGGVGAALPAGTKMRYNLFITKEGKILQERSTCHQLSFCLQSLGHCQIVFGKTRRKKKQERLFSKLGGLTKQLKINTTGRWHFVIYIAY
jgi:hypothetical protein